jgi:hypothetical protein
MSESVWLKAAMRASRRRVSCAVCRENTTPTLCCIDA